MGIEVLVREEDFLETYSDEQQELLQKFYSQQNYRPVQRQRPVCLQQLDRARELGLLPVITTSPRFIPLSRLCDWVFWTGSVGASYEVRIVEAPDRLRRLQDYWKQKLPFQSRVHMENNNLVLGQDGKLYGRILHCMGIPVIDRKSKHDVRVPQAVLATHRSRADFLQVMLYTRSHAHSPGHWSVRLLQIRSYPAAQAFGKEIVTLMNDTFPRVCLTEKDLRMTRKENEGPKSGKYLSYSPRISLSEKHLKALDRHYGSILHLQPRSIAQKYAQPNPATLIDFFG